MAARLLLVPIGLVTMGLIAGGSVAWQPRSTGLSDQDKAAIRQLDEAAAGQPSASVKRTEISLDGAGDFAYRHYAYERTAAPGGTSADKGHGLRVVRRQPDGSWRVVSEVSSSEVATAGLTIPTAEMAADASPEVAILGRIVGRWTLSAKDSKGLARSEAMTCAWFSGGRDVICRTSGVVAGREEVQIDQFSYDRFSKSYGVLSNNSSGISATGTLSVQPGLWMRTIDWKDESGVAYRTRWTFQNLVLGGGDFRIEYSGPDGPWSTFWTGTYAKEP